ncbi:cystathione beta-lyase [Eubacterium ruminantium]|nr:cystathione beta-lyase [Eubacterium ruminantium]
MGERNLDFDTVQNRKGTDSLKYDFAAARGYSEEALPLWVADMDFKISSYIQDALQAQVQHGIYGYTETAGDYYDAVAGWMKRHHEWNIDGYKIIKTPGVVPAIGAAINAFTEKGDAVLIQQPVYYCFTEVIEFAGRRVVSNDLILEKQGSGEYGNEKHDDKENDGLQDNRCEDEFGSGRYTIDLKDFEKKIIDEKIKLFLLCNPHNPGGRVWTIEELRSIAEICKKHNVVVFSDEIHEDIVYSGKKHTVFATVSEEAEEITLTATSPGKTFNISGLQIGNIIIKNRELAKRFKKSVNGNMGYSQANAPGIAACRAAYNHGDEWYEAMLKYLESNLQYLIGFLKEELPEVRLIIPDATYLVFLDLRGLGLTNEERRKLIVDKAKLWLDSGEIFGALGRGFERINIACPKSILKEALERLRDAVKSRV